MIYYLNAYLTVEHELEEYYIVEKSFSTSGFTSEQRRIFKGLVEGEGIEKKYLLRVFDAEFVDNLIEQKIILPYEIDMSAISSRNESYFFNKGLKDASEILKNKKVLILGCGGLGTHMAWNMVVLGVGTVYLLDYDVVDISNLNRQIYFDINDVGHLKTEVLKEKLEKVNPSVNIIARNLKITSEKVLEQELTFCNPDCVIKALDSPVYITQWIDHVCEKYKIRYVSAIMFGSSQLIGPTYIPNETLNFSDFFQMNGNRDRERGIAPSLGFVMYQMAGELAEEVFKILIDKGELKYKDKMVIHENVNDRTSVMFNRKKYPAEDKNYYFKYNMIFSFCLLAIYYIGSCFLLNQFLTWGIALAYTVLVPGILAHTDKEAFMFSFILLCEIVVLNILLVVRNGMGNLFGMVGLNSIPMLISALLIVLSVVNLVVYMLDYIIYIIKKMIIRKISNDRNN